MNGNTIPLTTGLLCVLALQAQTQEPPHAFAASALVDIDFGGIPPGELSVDSLPAGLGDAELDLAWNGKGGASATAVLVGEDGTAGVDQAWGSITTERGSVDFGLFTLPHGIIEGRLIHDPLVQEHIESILPGVAGTLDAGVFSPSVALSSRERVIESDDGISEPGHRPEAVGTAAIDWHHGEDGLVRASTQISTDRRDVVLAGTLPMGKLLVDAEIAGGWGSERAYDAGFLAGAAFDLTESVQIAARADGVLLGGEWTNAVAAGGTWKPVDGASIIAEWLQEIDGDGILTLRMGVDLGWTSTN